MAARVRASDDARFQACADLVGWSRISMTAARLVSVASAFLLAVPGFARAADAPGIPDRGVIDRYCLGCHSVRAKAGNFVLEGLDPARTSDDVESWEKVVRKL